MEKFKGGVHDHTPNPDNVPLMAIQKKKHINEYPCKYPSQSATTNYPTTLDRVCLDIHNRYCNLTKSFD